MRYLILLLMLGCAYAQPVIGPFQVWLAPEGYHIRGLECVVYSDSVQVFAATRNSGTGLSLVGTVPLKIEASPHAGTMSVLDLDSSWLWKIEGTFADSSGRWLAAISGGEVSISLSMPWYYDFWSFDGEITTRIFSGRGSILTSLLVHEDNWPYIGCHGQVYLSGADFSHSEDSTYIVSFTGNSCYEIWPGGPSEPAYFARILHLSPPANEVVSQTDLLDLPAPLYGPSVVRHCLINQDSIEVVTTGEGGSAENGLTIVDLQQGYQSSELGCPLQDTQTMVFGKTRGGDFLLGCVPNVIRVEDSGECETLGTIADWQGANSVFFHPDYGFAALRALPGYLLLARIDTSGNDVQPVGVIHATDGTSFMVDADVTISDSGQVIAVWSEYSDWSEGPRTLKIAWTNWATYLDTPEQNAPEPPSEFALSAYPNPFNSSVTIQYDLPQAGHVKLTAYDLQGRVVSSLFDDFAPAGSSEFRWTPKTLASGVYFVSLNTPARAVTSKLLYLK